MSKAVVVEIFCGKSGLSKRLRQKRFQVIAVDHVAFKGVPILQIDISKPAQREVLEELLSLDLILYVHFAPPCGTASAARHIQPGPPPLRSYLFPMGLPGLNFVQKLRVQKANFLYKWTCDMVLKLDSRHIGWSIENPASSLMWITDPFTQLLGSVRNLIAFSFHTCMFAAKRKKDTAIWTSIPQLRQHLERKCDDRHEHLPWGKTATGFATAEECAYNDTLCASWAEAIYDYALTQNFSPPPEIVDEVTASSSSAQHVNKAILGCLPRGRKMVPLFSELLQPTLLDISGHPAVQTLALGKRIPDSCEAFPKGSKLFRFVNVKGGLSLNDDANANFFNANVDATCHEFSGEHLNQGLPTHAMIGIPREPMEFLREACKLTHPTEMAMSVSQLLIDNINAYSDSMGLAFRRKQCNFAKQLVQLCSELQDVEKACKEGMRPHVREVLRNKRLKLFGYLLETFAYPDAKIAEEMANGFPLCGWLPASGVFPAKVRTPEISEAFLRKMAKSFTARSIASTTSTGDLEADRKLWQATLDEVAEGFLSGPLGMHELGRESVVSPRFGLQQKQKLRPIDNFSSSHVNSATGLQERFVVDTVDEICGMVKTWMQQGGRGVKLVGKTYDMRKAYRQIAISEDHLDFAWIVVWDPDRCQPALFRMKTMPFGATASVGAFLRLSQAIKMIGISLGGLVWSSFYDDFVCICRAGTETQTDRMVRLLFQSLGWELSSDAEKDKPFAEIFGALGVEFNLTNVPEGWFTVGNTEARRAELREKIDGVLTEDKLDPSTAESLRSRLLFADAQLFGRFAKLALHRIGAVGLKTKTEQPLSPGVRVSLEWILERILTGPPRRIDSGGRATFFLFLDGACTEKESLEWSGTSIGAVLADSYGRILHFFGHIVSDDLVSSWGPPDKLQHIFEAEVLPYAISLFVWSTLLRGCNVFAFIDNEAAKASWISGFATSIIARTIIHNGTIMEADHDVHPFFARVPTSSNMGDDPSRGRFGSLERHGASRTTVTDDMIKRICTHSFDSFPR